MRLMEKFFICLGVFCSLALYAGPEIAGNVSPEPKPAVPPEETDDDVILEEDNSDYQEDDQDYTPEESGEPTSASH